MIARASPLPLAGVLAAAVLLAGSGDAHAAESTIVAFGDSLSAGYGLAPEDAFPVRLEAALRARGHDVEVRNAGVSGDTTAAALGRLDWAIGEKADGVILELGANDALRGIDPDETRTNLEAILTRLKDRGLPVLLAGMLAPRNLGTDYDGAFDAIFPALAKEHGVAFYPFFLEGVATRPELNQDDGIHPNAAGVEAIVERILPTVEELIVRIEQDDSPAG